MKNHFFSFKKSLFNEAIIIYLSEKYVTLKFTSRIYGLCLLLCCSYGVASGSGLNGGVRQEAGSIVPDSIMKLLLDGAEINSHRVKEYECELYLKGKLTVHKKNRIIKYVPSMFKLEKGINQYMHESVSSLHYTAPGIYDRKIKAVSTTFPNPYGEVFDFMDYVKFNVYGSSVMENKVLSPFSKQSRKLYQYYIEDVAENLEGKIYQIRVAPLFNSTQLLEGSFWVSDTDWTIKYMDVKGKYALMTYHLSMRMGDTEETKFMPQLFNLDLDFKFLRNHLEMNYTGWMTYSKVALFPPDGKEWLELRKTRSHNLSTSYTLTCDTSQVSLDPDSFNRIRPIPLDNEESVLYRERKERLMMQAVEDTLQKRLPVTRKKRNMVFLGQLGDALISSYNIDLSKVGSVNCSPIINPLYVSYSHRKGLAYKQVFKYNKLFHDGRLLRIVPQVGYNFTKKELYASADVQYIYNPQKQGRIEVSAGNGNRIYSSVVLDQLEAQPDSTLSFDGLNLDYFKDVYVNASHNIEIVNGLQLWTGVSMHWRYTKSTPEVEARVRSRYNSFAPRVRIEWTPGMYYYMNGNRKINVGSHYPTFMIDYERGLHILKNSGKYERIEIAMQQMIRLKHVNYIAYRIGAGCFTNQDDLYFVDYVNFANRNLPQSWDDEIGGTFQMLDGRWYNASSHYIQGNLTYESPFILLYPVSKLLSFIQKERLYAGILFMPYLNPYIELGYGFATHLFDAGIFVGNEKGKFTSIGCKFTFELFND